MARFKRKSYSRGVARRGGFRRSTRSSGGSSDLVMGAIVPGAAYGAVRGPVVNTIMSFTGRFAGDYTDEIIGGVGSYVAAKWGSGFIKTIGKTGLAIESASVGSKLTSGMMGGSTTIQGSTNQGFGW